MTGPSESFPAGNGMGDAAASGAKAVAPPGWGRRRGGGRAPAAGVPAEPAPPRDVRPGTGTAAEGGHPASDRFLQGPRNLGCGLATERRAGDPPASPQSAPGTRRSRSPGRPAGAGSRRSRCCRRPRRRRRSKGSGPSAGRRASSTVPELFRFLTEHLWEDEPYLFVHPWTCPLVHRGHASLAVELLEAAPDVESVFIPVGGGGPADRSGRGAQGPASGHPHLCGGGRPDAPRSITACRPDARCRRRARRSATAPRCRI